MRVLLCEARPNVLAKLTRAGLVGEHAGKPRYFQELSAAVRACSPEAYCPESSVWVMTTTLLRVVVRRVKAEALRQLDHREVVVQDDAFQAAGCRASARSA